MDRCILEAARLDAEWLAEPGPKGRAAGWTFVRVVKARPDLRALTAIAAWRAVEPTITQLLNGPDCEGLDCLRAIEDAGDLATTFVLNWRNCRMVYGETEIDRASELAQAYPLTRNDPDDTFEHLELYRKLISLAGWLQRVRGDQPIILPVRMVGERIGCSHERAAALIRLACEEGHLFAPKACDRGKRKAAEYRFRVEFFPILRTGPPNAVRSEHPAAGSAEKHP